MYYANKIDKYRQESLEIEIMGVFSRKSDALKIVGERALDLDFIGKPVLPSKACRHYEDDFSQI